jgi:hypothetical protein
VSAPDRSDLLTFFFRHGGELVVDYDGGSGRSRPAAPGVRPPVRGAGATLDEAFEDLVVNLHLREPERAREEQG